jgi:hypothetical protein
MSRFFMGFLIHGGMQGSEREGRSAETGKFLVVHFNPGWSGRIYEANPHGNEECDKQHSHDGFHSLPPGHSIAHSWYYRRISGFIKIFGKYFPKILK